MLLLFIIVDSTLRHWIGALPLVVRLEFKEGERMLTRAESEFVEDSEVNSRLVIKTSSFVATVGDNFLCVTLDYGGNATEPGLLHDKPDLHNPLFAKTLAGLAPLMVRIGGTYQDLVVYDVGDHLSSEPCSPFIFNESALFSHSGGCLSMERWDTLNQLFIKTGASVAFGLNALSGRVKSKSESVISSPWNPSNAENLIRYTRDRAYPVIAWELGNELLGDGVGIRVPAELYAADVKKLRDIIDKLYQGNASKPSVVAPDLMKYGTEFTQKELSLFLQSLGQDVIDVVTRHLYNLGSGDAKKEDTMRNVLSSSVAEDEVENYKSFQRLLNEHDPKIIAWIGESGGAYHGGQHEVTDAFISAFWYLDQLGTASKYNNQAFCRQTFIGSHYGLVDSSFNPYPDYYGALLWSQLMGKGVFDVEIQGGTKEVRAYAHCQRSNKGGLTLLVLNYSNSTRHHLNLSLLSNLADESHYITKHLLAFSEASSEDMRLEYHMSAPNSNMSSDVVLLNGQLLLVTASGELPTLAPVKVNSASPISLEPLTYAYVVIPNANVPACSSSETSGSQMTVFSLVTVLSVAYLALYCLWL
ncbi:hypothetical protein R1sor_001817 [Riccia sorocarpa]|uniref:Uncharacterized protein n=1 Tax=Riccia sorocarpa TaxID=122646 RepID=A0ABD3H070_9MARC